MTHSVRGIKNIQNIVFKSHKGIESIKFYYFFIIQKMFPNVGLEENEIFVFHSLATIVHVSDFIYSFIYSS